MTTRVVRFGESELDIGRLTPTKKELLKNAEVKSVGSNYNGYGYSDWKYIYTVDEKTFGAMRDIVSRPAAEKKQKTEEEKTEEWARRLDRLTGCGVGVAMEIAREKLDYKNEKIDEMYERQYGGVSARRGVLIRRMERENPLRRIEDTEHAFAILQAHSRHAETDYEEKLSEGREMAAMGIIDRGEVKEYARNNMSPKKKRKSDDYGYSR